MRKKNKIIKIISAGVLAAGLLLSSAMSTFAEGDIPYDSYNYNYREDIVFTPAPYVPDGNIIGLDVGITNFKEPQDLCVSDAGEIYVADTGNNRVVVMNREMSKVNRIIEGFDMNGKAETFNAPSGLCVSENNELYIADSNNKRIVVLTPEGEFVKIVDNPQSEILEDDFDFVPLKVTVDYADRVYVIAKKAYEGILVFENTGDFTGYFGTIEVKITLWEKFWRRIASKEERANQ